MKRYGMGSDSAAALVISRRGMGIYFEKLPERSALQTGIKPTARKHVFSHWQSFSSHYKSVKSRNDWFAKPILTGSHGNSSSNTGVTVSEATVKGNSKALKKIGQKPCHVAWV